MNLRIAIWNANGLSNPKAETFLKLHFIVIFLISETHFNKKSFFKINGFDLICCNHLDDRCHGGSAILVKSNIQYDILDDFKKPYLQAAGIRLKNNNNKIDI